MRAKKIEEFVKRYWAVLLFFSSTIGAAATYFQEELKSFLPLQEAKVLISAASAKAELYKKIDIDARIDSIGAQKLSPGTLTIEADSEYVSIKPSRSINLDTIDGSELVANLPELKVIKLSPTPVKVTAVYVSGNLRVPSNDLFIETLQPEKVVHPHFDRSDTGRVNLSGEWTVELGGNPGKMNLLQGTNNKISGTYEIPNAKWPTGEIDGFKDGATFRVEFKIPGKDGKEKVWVAGHFEIQSSNGDFIEINGCAYQLRWNNAIYNKVGKEGVDCARMVNYDRWKVVQTLVFYASSPFDKQE